MAVDAPACTSIPYSTHPTYCDSRVYHAFRASWVQAVIEVQSRLQKLYPEYRIAHLPQSAVGQCAGDSFVASLSACACKLAPRAEPKPCIVPSLTFPDLGVSTKLGYTSAMNPEVHLTLMVDAVGTFVLHCAESDAALPSAGTGRLDDRKCCGVWRLLPVAHRRRCGIFLSTFRCECRRYRPSKSVKVC